MSKCAICEGKKYREHYGNIAICADCSNDLNIPDVIKSLGLENAKLKAELVKERELSKLAMTDVVNIYEMEDLHPIFQDDAIRFEKILKERDQSILNGDKDE